MATQILTRNVLEQILSGVTRVSRRCEIFESDGSTLWVPSSATPRLVDGNVSVDASRTERRSVDLTLDNADGVIQHDPSGFWYDKILKVYRGISWDNEKLIPSVVVVANDAANVFVKNLRKMGFTDLTLRTTATTLKEITGFDIVAAGAEGGIIPTAQATLVNQAYQAGMAVLTQGNGNTSTELPWATTTIAKSNAQAWELNRPTYDTPVSNNWSSVVTGDTTTGRHITVLDATARAVALYTWNANPGFTSVIAQNNVGGRWFHMQPKLTTTIIPDMRQLMINGVQWLYGYNTTVEWETQVGEFMIDRIDSDWFPSLVRVTGRDYTKAMAGTSFNNALTFQAGSVVEDVIEAIAANAGIFKTIRSGNGALLTSDISFDRGTDRWVAVVGVAAQANMEVFFNAQGYLVSRPFLDPSLSPISLALSTGGTDGNLVTFTKSSNDSRIYNYIVVTGEDPSNAVGGLIFQGIAANTEPTSPTRIKVPGVPGGLFQRSYTYTSSFFTSNEQCLAYAQSLLKYHALEEFNLDFESLAFPWLEAGEILQFSDPDKGGDEPDRYLLSNFNIPLGLGPMAGNGKRVTIVGQATSGGGA